MRLLVLLALVRVLPFVSALPVAETRTALGTWAFYGIATQGSVDETSDRPTAPVACRRGGFVEARLSLFVVESEHDTLRLVVGAGEALARAGAIGIVDTGGGDCVSFRVEGVHVGSAVFYEVWLVPTPF